MLTLKCNYKMLHFVTCSTMCRNVLQNLNFLSTRVILSSPDQRLWASQQAVGQRQLFLKVFKFKILPLGTCQCKIPFSLLLTPAALVRGWSLALSPASDFLLTTLPCCSSTVVPDTTERRHLHCRTSLSAPQAALQLGHSCS